MKKQLLSIFLIAISLIALGQNTHQRVPKYVGNAEQWLSVKNRASLNDLSRTLTCTDTIRYPQAKEQVLGNPVTFYTFDCWKSDNEAISQTFLLSGSTLSIAGVEFFGRKAPYQTASGALIVRASIFNVDANNRPTGTALAQNTLSINDTNFTYRYINFSTPVSVSNNFAVVIEPTSTGGIVEYFINNAAPNQSYDENLSRYKSNYYTQSGGNWVSIPTLTTGSPWTTGPYDFEMIVAPRISYTINTDFTLNPTSACIGEQINFTNATTPTAILSNRMFNFNAFAVYFQSALDSTYVYNPDPSDQNAPLIWSANASYVYNTANTYNPTLFTLGGFWNSCLDNKSKTVTINVCTDVDENLTKNVFIITPNPASDYLNISISNIKNLNTLQIFSSIGKLIYSENINTNFYNKTLDIKNYPKGIYFMSLTDDTGQRICKKIIFE